MAEIFNISDGVRLGLHAALILAHSDRPLTTKELKRILGVSAAHLAKILSQLERFGIVKSKSGPGGGYWLALPPGKNTLLAVYEAIAGQLVVERCPLAVPVCDGGGCPLGAYFIRLNREIATHLKSTTLKEIKINLKEKRGRNENNP